MGAPASQVQCTIRQCRTECGHTKERWIASTECLFNVYAKWMDGQVEGFFFFFTTVVHERDVSDHLFRFLISSLAKVKSGLIAPVKSYVYIH